MDIFAALEERVDRLLKTHGELRSRITELEAENHQLREGSGEAEKLTARITELEQERETVRGRVGRLLEQLRASE
ncbi:MAG: cell division protein ZapB [Acidobacteriota bacterium]